MKDLKLDEITHDLVTDTDLQLVSGIDYYAQKVKIVLWFFLAEWFLDTSKGINYIGQVFGKNPNLTLIDNLFKIAILEIDGFLELLQYDSDFDIPLRKLTVDFKADTDAGELSQTQEVSL
jgi:hypothetical protein